MSKYKVGDRFIVEISEVSPNGKRYTLNRDNGAYALEVVEEWELDRLSRAEKTYADGLADAWEAAKKIYLNEAEGGLSDAGMDAIFGDGWHVADVIRGSTPQEAVAKIKAYEDGQKLRRGDEVTDGEQIGIVTHAYKGDRNDFSVLWRDGSSGRHYKTEGFSKTGRNFAGKLDALLAEIGGSNDVEEI